MKSAALQALRRCARFRKVAVSSSNEVIDFFFFSIYLIIPAALLMSVYPSFSPSARVPNGDQVPRVLVNELCACWKGPHSRNGHVTGNRTSAPAELTL
jgi:hypothetical protein